MIIGSADIYDVAALISGLQKAARGVMRVTIESASKDGFPTYYSTGWLITDTLTVIPDYAALPPSSMSSEARYLCQIADGKNKAIEGALISDLPATRDGRPVLLRLRGASSERALKLDLATTQRDQWVFVLHHALGSPELKISNGRLVDVERLWLRYDADTQPGSGGGPIFSAISWSLVGMHVKASKSRRFNEGLSLAAILMSLRASPAWGEIAEFHKLADVTGVRRQLKHRVESPASDLQDSGLLKAALRWSFDPGEIPLSEQNQLRALVTDGSARRWTLRASERQRLIRSAGSLDLLRRARGHEDSDDPGQRVIDRILGGPPYRLDEVEDTALPYWLQAVRWFSDVVPSLPTPADVNRTHERRRVRSRLLGIAGPDFRGRAEELGRLREWYKDQRAGPMVISGIGGVGKSALIARFATSLPANTLLLWLDFDRADLAPDDAVSVLGLLADQVTVQVEGFSPPPLDASSWEDGADRFGAMLARAIPEASAPLLVLDGFEVARHVEQHQEIWRVLERVLAEVPTLRVVVSGRSSIRDLVLRGRPVCILHLIGMAPADAQAWLREHNITDPSVLARVLEISNGVPLVLKLAVRLIEAGGEVRQLPEELPKTLIEGFLYQRILDRLIDPLLKPVARDALVLRSVTAEMIPDVLGDSVPEGLESLEVWSRLVREMALVEDHDGHLGSQELTTVRADGNNVLYLRPEVRSATLRLLEMDNAARVRMIDERAAAWYARQDVGNVSNAAELVYHRLRLGDLSGAKQAWRDECALLLLHADDDLPETAYQERAWLQARTGDMSVPSASLKVWEKEAAERIRAVIGRGLLRAVPEILTEREERSTASPLALYDAWIRWNTGDLSGARIALDVGQEIRGPIERDRAVLGALFAAQVSESPKADQLLAKVEDERWWGDRSKGRLEVLAVRAARARLAVDLQAEIELSDILRKEDDSDDDTLPQALQRFLAPSDVVLPSLSQRFGSRVVLESMGAPLSVPLHLEELETFAHQLDGERRSTLDRPHPFVLHWDVHTAPADLQDAWTARDFGIDSRTLGLFRGRHSRRIQRRHSRGIQLGLDLAVLGWRRWRIATTSLLLADACKIALRPDEIGDPLGLSIAGTLAAFRGQEMEFPDSSIFLPSLDHVLLTAVEAKRKVVGPAPSANRVLRARELLRHEGMKDEFGQSITKWLNDTAASAGDSASAQVREYFPDYLLHGIERAELYSVVLYLLAPDPLEMLCRRLIGVPDNLTV